MKKIIALLTIFLTSSSIFAAEFADYEAVSKALTHATETLRSFTKSAAEKDAMVRRDPMQPLMDDKGNIVRSAGLKEGFGLQGIMWSEKFKKTVLIDEQFYTEGDVVDNYQILEIRPNGFTAKMGKDTIFIPLYPDRQTEEEATSKS